MFCQSCGHQILNEAQFCINCGKKIETCNDSHTGSIQRKYFYHDRSFYIISGILVIILLSGFFLWREYETKQAQLKIEIEKQKRSYQQIKVIMENSALILEDSLKLYLIREKSYSKLINDLMVNKNKIGLLGVEIKNQSKIPEVTELELIESIKKTEESIDKLIKSVSKSKESTRDNFYYFVRTLYGDKKVFNHEKYHQEKQTELNLSMDALKQVKDSIKYYNESIAKFLSLNPFPIPILDTNNRIKIANSEIGTSLENFRENFQKNFGWTENPQTGIKRGSSEYARYSFFLSHTTYDCTVDPRNNKIVQLESNRKGDLIANGVKVGDSLHTAFYKIGIPDAVFDNSYYYKIGPRGDLALYTSHEDNPPYFFKETVLSFEIFSSEIGPKSAELE